MTAEDKTAESQEPAAQASEAPPVTLDVVRPKTVEAAPQATEKAAEAKPAPAPAPAKPVPAAEAAKPAGQPKLQAESRPKAAVAPAALAPMARLTGLAETYGYYAAGAMVVLGIGWIIGVNSFDNRASEKRVAEALVALDRKIDQVASKVVTTTEVAALKRNLEDTKRSLEGARRTSAAIADLRTRVDAAEKVRAAAADGLADKVVAQVGKDQGERFDKVAERLDKLEHQLASQIPTASIPTPQARGPEAAQVPATTMPMASMPAAASTSKDKDAHALPLPKLPENGYVLRQVIDGVALVEGRRGLMEVEIGDMLPGAGRVRAIERRNRKWVVLTTNGVIDGNGY